MLCGAREVEEMECCHLEKKKQIYNAVVLPIIVRLFGKNRVQNYGMRIILSRSPRTHSDDLHKELNWTTLEARRNMNRLCLVYKYVCSQVPATLSSRFEANKGRTKGSMHLYKRGANTNFIHIQRNSRLE